MVERQGLGFRGLLTKTLNDGKDTQRGALPEYDGDFKGPRISLWFHISPHWIAVFPAGTQDVPLALLESFEILVVPLVSVVVACFGAPIFCLYPKTRTVDNRNKTQRIHKVESAFAARFPGLRKLGFTFGSSIRKL